MDDKALRRSHLRLLFSLAAFAATLIAVSMIGEVDIATKAIGRLIPDGQVKVIQTFETGYIADILVREGAQVQAGDVLLRLDPTDAIADEQRIATDLAVARVEFARRQAKIDSQRR